MIMPNYCDNDLYVSGPEEALNEFYDFNTREGERLIDFNRYIPYPETFKKMDEAADISRVEQAQLIGTTQYVYVTDGFNSGGYEWRNRNWGTKWNTRSEDTTVERTDGVIFYNFDTAWAPPIPVVIAMSIKHPKLTFRIEYFERGMAFQGVFEVTNGITVVDEENEYDGERGG